MSVNDPIADMLTRIRNACMARHTTVQMPSSKMKIAIAEILKREGFIRDFRVKSGTPFDTIVITLKYTTDRRPVITGPQARQQAWVAYLYRPRRYPACSRRPGVEHPFDSEGCDGRARGLAGARRRRSAMLRLVAGSK